MLPPLEGAGVKVISSFDGSNLIVVVKEVVEERGVYVNVREMVES